LNTANAGRRQRLLVLALCLTAAAAACRGRFAHAVGPDEGRLVASKTGERYHRPECKLARRIAAKHLLYYRTGDDAYADGFTPCQVCRPEVMGRQDVPAPGQVSSPGPRP
jgi:Metal binding domain of Ada